MAIIADLHVHSKYARATSKQLVIPIMEKFAKIKGVSILGTGDAQHPKWFNELKENLNDDDKDGIYRTKTNYPFMLSSELSLVYSQGGKGRRVHMCALFPSLDIVKQVQEFLLTKGRIDYDGRPIFNIPCDSFTEEMMRISKDIELFPAHIWTPWFAMFGSASGFDSMKDCFGDQLKNIHAIETGISSDPQMNWRVSQLDNMQIVSFSDAHSHWPWRLGREATVFDCKLTYKDIIHALRTGDGLKSTIEFFPEEGKYHYDGHRKCNFCTAPKQAWEMNNICPKCEKEMTIGVMHRVEELSDRDDPNERKDRKPFHRLIPLSELIASVHGSAVSAKKVFATHDLLMDKFGNEFNVLLHADTDEIAKITDFKLAHLIIANRKGNIKWNPGYDGVYGTPDLSEYHVPGMKHPKEPEDSIETKEEKEDSKTKKAVKKNQKSLGEF